jgi:hypothetical protein
MTVDEVTLKKHGGKGKVVTRVRDTFGTIVFDRRLSRGEALRSAARVRKSIERFSEFNRKSPRHIVERQVDLDVPLVRIGKVPVITYESRKEGRKQSYAHETKRMPTLYMHPSKPIGLLIGGSLKVRDWLYD